MDDVLMQPVAVKKPRKFNYVVEIIQPTYKSDFIKRIQNSLKEPIKQVFLEHKDLLASFPAKIASEIISHFIAIEIKKYFLLNCPDITVKTGKWDNNHDLVFIKEGEENYNFEIKVTSTESWRGGEFSKRECDHLMVCYSKSKSGIFSVFASVLFLKHSDWVSNISEGYYAPTLGKKYIFSRKDRNDIIGALTHKTKKMLNIRINKETIE